ncbi:hypothetical protein QA601_10890 [Chitinispirillales bacterium ANBcel5]|uniref:hypothetical protein n=1 Tax=Cellulosispirillum alkaliphilum TaxID=3039283 RepID=UPI002A58A028|nr:hypothetical protein [Chitinispirillales bacterium ANBcel5]
MSIFEVKCPMCKGTLWIDPVTSKVVEHRSAEEKKMGFEEFLNSRKKGVCWDDKFKKAKEEERKRKEQIEQKFRSAKNDSSESSEDSKFRSPLDWD